MNSTSQSRLLAVPLAMVLAVLEARCIELRGGAIVAWGASDIADPDSGLHERWRVGPRSYGPYHSVDTGKYCLAPLFAMEVADRILPA